MNKIEKAFESALSTSFKKILATEFHEPLEMLYFALSIFAISFGVYFMHKAH